MNQTQFATRVLTGLGVKPNSSNVRSFVGWMAAEGGHWHNNAKFNPLNTTQPAKGAGNTGTQGNIKVYRSWSQGIQATIQTLKNGHYNGIIHALGHGTPGQVAQAIGASPWGTSAVGVARAIGATPPTARAASVSLPTPSSLSVPTTQDPQRQAIIAALLQGGKSPLTSAANAFQSGVYGSAVSGPTSDVTAPAQKTPSSSGGSAKGLSPLKELFWQGQGGVNVKNGKAVPQGFVNGHTDHVHVGAGPKTVVKFGQLAQAMGLHVGENPHFGVVHKVHVPDSLHYKGEAIDVSGDPAKMEQFAHHVAAVYGIQQK